MPYNAKYRVLLVSSHPVQYAAPLLRLLANHPKLEILAAYCSLQGAEAGEDPEFGVKVAWDVPLLEGYPWVRVPNRSLRPGLGRFWGLLNPDLWGLISVGRFDAVVIYTGYACASFWVCAAAAKRSGAALLFGTDAVNLAPRSGHAWKARLKEFIWPRLFRMADMVIVPSSGGVQLMRALGLPAERIALTPYVVNNDWFLQRARQASRTDVRRELGIPDDDFLILFCAKLVPWKRPQDLLHALARMHTSSTHIVCAGEGPLRGQLERSARDFGLADRVRFLGFVNQSRLPGFYAAAEVMVLPSAHEPFGVVVNEAMSCGCPVIVSDRVGARLDLVRHGETGWIYPCGDIRALAALLEQISADRDRLRQMGQAARRRMETWSPAQNVEALFRAIEKAVAFKQSKINSEDTPLHAQLRA